MRAIKIGLLQGVDIFPVSISTKLRYLADTQIVQHNERRSNVEALIIPPNVGVNPCLRTFIHGNRSVLPFERVDPYVMYFMEYNLQHYVDLKIPVIALGDSAVYIWSYLGGKTAVISNGYNLISPPEVDIIEKNSDLIVGFMSNNLYGFININSAKSSSTIFTIIQDKIKESNDTSRDFEESIQTPFDDDPEGSPKSSLESMI